MDYVIIAGASLLAGGALGYLFGGKIEAAAWKEVIAAKGFAVSEFEKLRKAL
jgi:hypothetical protein